jgi:hypothetical protein
MEPGTFRCQSCIGGTLVLVYPIDGIKPYCTPLPYYPTIIIGGGCQILQQV